MKYIGATDFFTRAPFVIEGMVIGVIGSFVPLIAVFFIYNEAMMYVAKRFPSLSQLLAFLPVETVFTNLVPVCIGRGHRFYRKFYDSKKAPERVIKVRHESSMEIQH